MNDPLAKYRNKAALAPGLFAPPDEPVEYAAFATKDRVERLKIKLANESTRAPGYNNLLEVVYDGPYGKTFTLNFNFLIVMVEGKNLQPIIMALLAGTADFIQEFDPRIWEKPADSKKPIIEFIKVIVTEKALENTRDQQPSL
jgi:hypothetical protein